MRKKVSKYLIVHCLYINFIFNENVKYVYGQRRDKDWIIETVHIIESLKCKGQRV